MERATGCIRVAFGELPAAIWYGIFPVATVAAMAGMFGIADQGRELLAALSFRLGAPRPGYFGLTQSVAFAVAALTAVLAVAYSSSAAMRAMPAAGVWSGRSQRVWRRPRAGFWGPRYWLVATLPLPHRECGW